MSPITLQLQRDSFEKVERVFVMGLRARDSVIRQKFFALYNAAIECTLFARMRYIIVEQDWEQLAQFFWLKQALVRRADATAHQCLFTPVGGLTVDRGISMHTDV